MFGKDNKKKELIAKLGDTFAIIQREHQISPGDFPNLKRMQEQLAYHDFTKFHALKPKLLDTVDSMLANDIARLMQMIPHEDESAPDNYASVQGGAFEGYTESPFGVGRGEGVDMGRGEQEWVVGREKYEYDDSFSKLNPINGKISGAAAKSEMVKSKLPNSVLSKVWKLADVDRDGMLDADEWALANHLIKIKLDGHDLPSELPDHLIPPSKRNDMAWDCMMPEIAWCVVGGGLQDYSPSLHWWEWDSDWDSGPDRCLLCCPWKHHAVPMMLRRAESKHRLFSCQSKRWWSQGSKYQPTAHFYMFSSLLWRMVDVECLQTAFISLLSGSGQVYRQL